MTIWFQLMLLGLGTGAIYATLAQGIVATWRGSAVVSIAHGAFAMYGGYVYYQLTSHGELVLPWIALPHRISLADEAVGPWPALGITVIISALMGYLTHALVFRHLERRDQLSRLIAGVGVLLVLQGIAFVQFGSETLSVTPLLQRTPRTIPGTSLIVTQDRLILAALAVAIGVVLAVLYRATTFGLRARAIAEAPDSARLLGIDSRRIAATNWVLAAAMAGLVGALAAPITGLSTTNFILFVVPALACALVGRFVSFGLATTAGFAFGLFEGIAPRIASRSWFPDDIPAAALARLVPLAVIIVAIVAGRDLLPERGARIDSRLPASPKPRHVVVTSVGLAGLAIAVLPLLGSDLRLAVFLSGASVMLIASVVMLTGWTGQVSLAHATAAGAAGFATTMFSEASAPFPVSLVLGAVMATAVGMLVAAPAVRVRGMQLAVITMATAVAIEESIFKNPAVIGTDGARLVEQPTIFGLDLAANRAPDFNRWSFGVLLIVSAAVVLAGIANIRRGATGRAFLALRANERAAAAVGLDTRMLRLLAFAISSLVAGIGGAYLAYVRGAVSATSFNVFAGLVLLAFAAAGGIASIRGAVLGALLVPGGLFFAVMARMGDGEPSRYAVLVGGIGLIVAMVMAPSGLGGIAQRRS